MFEIENRAIGQAPPSNWFPSRHERALARIRNNGELVIGATQVEVVKSATVIRGAEYLGRETVKSLQGLRRQEAYAAADDPIVADEFAAVRRTVLGIALDEIEDFARRTR